MVVIELFKAADDSAVGKGAEKEVDAEESMEEVEDDDMKSMSE